MNRPQAVNHCPTIDTHNLAIGKATLQDIESTLVINVAKERNHHGTITDIKIGITGGQPCISITNDSRHRKLHKAEWMVRQQVVVFFQKRVVLIGWVVFKGADDCLCVNEPSNVVNVAIGIVTNN